MRNKLVEQILSETPDHVVKQVEACADALVKKHSNEKQIDMSHEIEIPDAPRNGIYGGDVYKQWEKLLNEMLEFIPKHSVGAHIGGTCSMMRAKAKVIELNAKALVEICNATQPERT